MTTERLLQLLEAAGACADAKAWAAGQPDGRAAWAACDEGWILFVPERVVPPRALAAAACRVARTVVGRCADPAAAAATLDAAEAALRDDGPPPAVPSIDGPPPGNADMAVRAAALSARLALDFGARCFLFTAAANAEAADPATPLADRVRAALPFEELEAAAEAYLARAGVAA